MNFVDLPGGGRSSRRLLQYFINFNSAPRLLSPNSSITNVLAPNEALFVTENTVGHTNAKFRNAVTSVRCCTQQNVNTTAKTTALSPRGRLRYPLQPGLPGPSAQKMPNHLQKMPNRFKKCQTSLNRLNAVGFNITR